MVHLHTHKERDTHLTIASQIHSLLKEHGKLARTPRTTTVQERLDAGDYLYVTSNTPAPAPANGLRDQAGNPVSLRDYESAPSDEPRVVGVVMARKLNWYLGEVRHLVVAPEFRRHGLAKKLFDMAEAKLKMRKARVIVATDSSDDPGAVGDRYGFQVWDDEALTFSNESNGHDVTVLLKNVS